MSKSERKRRRSKADLLKLLAFILLIAAIVKELRLPKEERTWHGTLGGFVPYDFRKPTMDRFREAFWDPEGSIVTGRPMGVGWTINFGAVVAKVRSLSDAA
jgi:hypothetical protein